MLVERRRRGHVRTARSLERPHDAALRPFRRPGGRGCRGADRGDRSQPSRTCKRSVEAVVVRRRRMPPTRPTRVRARRLPSNSPETTPSIIRVAVKHSADLHRSLRAVSHVERRGGLSPEALPRPPRFRPGSRSRRRSVASAVCAGASSGRCGGSAPAGPVAVRRRAARPVRGRPPLDRHSLRRERRRRHSGVLGRCRPHAATRR